MDKFLLSLQERRCQLEDARVAAVAHLNCILGGIAEIDLLVDLARQQLAEEIPAAGIAVAATEES